MFAALCFASAGCGESTCQRAQRINRDLNTKASRGGCDAQQAPFIEENCEATARACTREDLGKLDDAFECFEDVQCEPFKEAEYSSNVAGCRPPLTGLSDDCALAAPALP